MRLATVSTYPAGFAFILSWLAPVWTIGQYCFVPRSDSGLISLLLLGAYDSCVHISEEAYVDTRSDTLR